MHDIGEGTEGKGVNEGKTIDEDYHLCWKGIKKHFDPNDRDKGKNTIHTI